MAAEAALHGMPQEYSAVDLSWTARSGRVVMCMLDEGA
jgi:hypothetical protein